MKKLIEFFPCPRCGQNIFEIWTTAEEKPYFKDLKLRNNIGITIRSPETNKDYFLCSQCSEVVFYEELSHEIHENIFIRKINDFIKEHPEKIDEKFKKIWARFLKQRLKSRLKEISN